MPKKMRYNAIIKVRLNSIPECSELEIVGFVNEALSSWGGQFEYEDPLFGSLDIKSIQIGSTTYVEEVEGYNDDPKEN